MRTGIFRVVIGGRDCIRGKLKAGDYLHSYDLFMVKVATAKTPYVTTSMFVSEATEPQRWNTVGRYIELDISIPGHIAELRKLLPYLTNGKKFCCMCNKKEQIRKMIQNL